MLLQYISLHAGLFTNLIASGCQLSISSLTASAGKLSISSSCFNDELNRFVDRIGSVTTFFIIAFHGNLKLRNVE